MWSVLLFYGVQPVDGRMYMITPTPCVGALVHVPLLRVVHPSIGEEEYACIHPSTHYMVMMMLPTYLEWYIHPSILLMMMDS